MSRSIRVDELAEAIEEQLNEYKALAADELKKAVKKAGKTAKTDINESAPVRTGRYAQSWKTKVTAEDAASIQVTVYSPPCQAGWRQGSGNSTRQARGGACHGAVGARHHSGASEGVRQ